jgi:plastocyanin
VRVPRRLVLIAAGLSIALLAPGRAHAGTQTLVFRTPAISVPGYGVVTKPMLVDSPHADGYVTGLTAEIVDARGRVQGRSKVMLHHIVFGKIGATDATCGGSTQRFYAEGEERTALRLPAGYGLPNKGTDRWYLLYMLMNHKPKTLTGYVRYTVTYVMGETLTPVSPVWLDVRNCTGLDPSFDVPGTGKRFSAYVRTMDWIAPQSGRIVAAGGHLHGGGIRLELHNTTCSTMPFVSEPTWGGPVPHPILHEPGPTHMSQFTSAEGIPVAAGQTLRLTAVYDNGAPHTRTMGIMILYMATGQVTGCGPTPKLDIDLGHPSYPPVFTFPLPVQPVGKVARGVTSSNVQEFGFEHPLVSLALGTTFTWEFSGNVLHDVTLVSGPVGFSSPWTLAGSFSHRFTRRGVYKLFCSLHPAQMSQIIVVR